MSAPEVSVLLVSWNTREETRRCLESLRRTAAGLSYEVVAVDNGSRDGSTEVLAAEDRVQLIRNDHNVGFAAAVNQAYRAATGELILLLNRYSQPGNALKEQSGLAQLQSRVGVRRGFEME